MKKCLLLLLFIAAQVRSTTAQEYGSVNLTKRIFNPDKDNKIYKRDREFQFDYQYTKNGTSYWIFLHEDADASDDFDLIADAVKDQPNLIQQISLKVIQPEPAIGRTNKYQSEMLIRFDPITYTEEWTGLIENKYNVWLHPPRRFLFNILELNPYPYVKYPLVIGHQWQDSMSIGDHWSDPRWKVWEGRIVNKYTYEIKGRTSISIEGKELPCWIIESSAKSSIGDTQLQSYFNEEYGFVKLDYTNIDGSKIILKVKKLPI